MIFICRKKSLESMHFQIGSDLSTIKLSHLYYQNENERKREKNEEYEVNQLIIDDESLFSLFSYKCTCLTRHSQIILSILDSHNFFLLSMGNCWRMPEDHSGLLHVSQTDFTSRPIPATVPSTHAYLAFTNSISPTSDTHTPKVSDHISHFRQFRFLFQLVTLSRSSADLNVIKAAQCRNLVERLPLINYKEKLTQQTE